MNVIYNDEDGEIQEPPLADGVFAGAIAADNETFSVYAKDAAQNHVVISLRGVERFRLDAFDNCSTIIAASIHRSIAIELVNLLYFGSSSASSGDSGVILARLSAEGKRALLLSFIAGGQFVCVFSELDYTILTV
jgi:hypothetical protein